MPCEVIDKIFMWFVFNFFQQFSKKVKYRCGYMFNAIKHEG